jgi:hypothetical protein
MKFYSVTASSNIKLKVIGNYYPPFILTLLFLSSLLLIPSMTSNHQGHIAYADEFRECDLNGIAEIESEDNNKRFKIEQDFEVDISRSPVNPDDVCEDTDARDAKKLRLERGETIRVTVGQSIEDRGSFCLADKGESDSSIALSRDCIFFFSFDCNREPPPEACGTGQFEVEIPEDIDKDNYKIVIGKSHDGDDVLDLYVNKVKIR